MLVCEYKCYNVFLYILLESFGVLESLSVSRTAVNDVRLLYIRLYNCYVIVYYVTVGVS